ncbi:WEB family protein At2g17940-like [Silene latifolia]|uniref:WEB family protein At2g17940-like n=1 Tax=Silene latifolia TaxID=37657 RepID=UPI003D7861B4
MEAGEGGVLVKGRAIIDTRPPFQSVKEAVALFGERVLVGEIYAKQLKEMEPKVVGTFKKQSNNNTSTITLGIVSSELEETKKKLQKEREEGDYIATCLKSVKEELDQTRRELMQLKTAKSYSTKQPKNINPEIEELNFVDNPTSKLDFEDDYGIYQHEYHRKKSVTFASPPSLTREIMHDIVDDGSFGRLGRSSSFRKELKPKEGKKRTINPIIGWFFQRKKKNFEGEFEGSPRL